MSYLLFMGSPQTERLALKLDSPSSLPEARVQTMMLHKTYSVLLTCKIMNKNLQWRQPSEKARQKHTRKNSRWSCCVATAHHCIAESEQAALSEFLSPSCIKYKHVKLHAESTRHTG